MPQYTKKPVTIEAVRWTGVALDGGAPSWVADALAKDPNQQGAIIRERDKVHVFTTEGVMIASPGDWIIRGVEGEIYPCRDSVFQATYVLASREADASGKPAITRAEADASLSAAPAPRVTVESMEAKVASAEYFRSKTLTICILTLANGFTIVGKSACASPENYNQALGERYAYDDAFRQIWAFEGYLLRERLSAA